MGVTCDNSGGGLCQNQRRVLTSSPLSKKVKDENNNNEIHTGYKMLRRTDTFNSKGNFLDLRLRPRPRSSCFKSIFKSRNIRVNKLRKWRGTNRLGFTSLFLILLSLWVDPMDAVCVWQGGPGFRIACGFRQSGLFRIRTLGGLKGYLGGGFTIGDEDGFRDSLTNTDPKQGQEVGAHGQNYANSYQRVDTREPIFHSPQGQGQSYPGVPLSLEEVKKREQLRYLQQIQAEQLLEYQVLQQQVAMQKQQKGLQKRRMEYPHHPPPPPPPPRRRGPKKRASAWNWPFRRSKGKGNKGESEKSNRGRGPPPPPPPQPRLLSQQSQMSPIMVHQGPNIPQGAVPIPMQAQPYPNSPVDRQGPYFQEGALDYDDFELPVFEDQIQHPLSFPMPNQVMIPPPSMQPPQFKQIPYSHDPVEREDLSHLQSFPHPSQQPPPRGMHRVFPSVAPTSLQARGLPTQEEEDEEQMFLTGLGMLDKEALATAVYDPNIFPDIYFTTTERGNQNQMEDPYLYDDLQHFDTAALHTNENVERMDSVVPEPRKKKKNNNKRRRKKFRILKKKGQVNSEVEQNVESEDVDVTRTQEVLPNDQQLWDQLSNNDTNESETQSQGKKKKRRRRKKKRPNSHNETFPYEFLPISPSPLTLTFPMTEPEPPTTTTTTMKPTIRMDTFSYYDALDRKKEAAIVEDVNLKDLFKDKEQRGEVDEAPYDPRFPPNHEVNRGKIPSKFIRQRGPSTTTIPTPTSTQRPKTTPRPFGSLGLNEISISPSFAYDDGQSTSKFIPSTERSSSFVKFDSTESSKFLEKTKTYNDQFYNSNRSVGFAPTGFSNPGFYDIVPKLEEEIRSRFPVKVPSYPKQGTVHEDVLLPWEIPSSTTSSFPVYPRNKEEGTLSFDKFNPPHPPRNVSPDLLKQNIFGGDDHSSNWEAPNFWGTIQQVDRFGPSSDFVTNDNFKRLLDVDQRNTFFFEPAPERNPEMQYPSTQNSFTVPSSTTPGWENKMTVTPRRPKVGPSLEPTPTPAVFITTSTERSGFPEMEEDQDNPGMRIEQLPVKELNLDDEIDFHNFNFISSTTTTKTPLTIKEENYGEKNTKYKRKKQKRPEVQIKIKGEHYPEVATTLPPNVNPRMDIKSSSSFNIRQRVPFPSESDRVIISQNGFDGNFVPSISPFLQDTNPFSNFESVFPKNPFTNIHAHPNGRGGQPHPIVIQNRQDSEELRQGQGQNGHPSPVGQRFEIESQDQSQFPQDDESLPNIVPSPPDPVLTSEVVPMKGMGMDLQAREIHILRPPQSSDEPNFKEWESNREVPMKKNLNLPPRPIQVLRAPQNPPALQHRERSKGDDFGREMFSQTFRDVQDEMLRHQGPQRPQSQSQTSPSIKIVRPLSQNKGFRLEEEEQGPVQFENFRKFPTFPENGNVMPASMQSMQHYPKPQPAQTQTSDGHGPPYVLTFPAVQHSSKSQFQKNGPPKKYQPEQGKHHQSKLPLPQNPYMNNNNNNGDKRGPLIAQPTKIPSQRFQPPPPSPPPSSKSSGFFSMFNPFNRGSKGSNNAGPSDKRPSNQHNPPENHMNPLNTRFQPPPPSPPTKGVEVTYVDLDDNLNPPRLIPPSFFRDQQERRPQRPRYQNQHQPPPPRNEELSDKQKVLEAIATLNNMNYNVIQSVAEEQFGQEIMERMKTKKEMEERISMSTTPRPMQTTPPTRSMFPILTTMAPLANSFINMVTTPKPEGQRMSPSSGLSNLLSSFGGYGDSAVGPTKSYMDGFKNPSMMSVNTDAITNLFHSLTSGEILSRATQTTTTSTPVPLILPSNSFGLGSESSGQDIKSLQAQIAKAIIAKANRKKTDPPSNPNPLGLINTLAQTKNYTQSQISTLKKLIALNNIEQKLNSQLGLESTTKKWSVGPTLMSLLPQEPNSSPNSIFSNKMLQDSDFHMLNSVQSNNGLPSVVNDPTLLALKALALKKAQSIKHQDPNASVSNKRDGSIPVDLSAILSPSPPLEEPKRRRLTDVKNAPRSFYPANATLGFDMAGSNPGSTLTTTFNCESQSFFPGLYADTTLGCKVFHLCAKTDAGYLTKSFRCPRETVFDQEVLKCNWSLFVECPGSESKYHFNKYLSQSFQFLKVLGEFSKNATTVAG